MAAGKRFVQLLCFIVLSSMLLSQLDARLFTVNTPGTSEACILVDIDFTIQLQAIKNHKVIASANLTSDDKAINVVGLCRAEKSEILLELDEKSFWYLAFQTETGAHAVGQYRGFQFLPSELFGEVVAGAKQQIFYDRNPVYQEKIDNSYMCVTKSNATYTNAIPTGEFDYLVNVTVSRIQSQGFRIKDNQFGPKEFC